MAAIETIGFAFWAQPAHRSLVSVPGSIPLRVFNVRFTDGKEFSISCSPVIVTDFVDFSDMKTGDEVILREYYRRRED